MADRTGIEWTDATWNPVTGCTEVSAGCDHCYAKTFAERFRGVPGHHFERGFDVQLRPDRLDLPLRLRRPRRIFVNSMSDLFHKDVPDGFIGSVWNTMALTPQHTYQILTKRPGRMRSLLQRWANNGWHWRDKDMRWCGPLTGPLPNVQLGVSVEDQRWADIRVPALVETPAAVRFVSCEPLLGAVNLRPWLVCDHSSTSWVDVPDVRECDHCGLRRREVEDPDGQVSQYRLGREVRRLRYELVSRGRLLDWVIVGGESGRGARPMHPEWVRGLRDQCLGARVPFLFKQWGEWAPVVGEPTPRDHVLVYDGRHIPWSQWPDEELSQVRVRAYSGVRECAVCSTPQVMSRHGKGKAGRVLDGRTWDQFPTQPVVGERGAL